MATVSLTRNSLASFTFCWKRAAPWRSGGQPCECLHLPFASSAIAQQLSQWKSLPQAKPFSQWKRALPNGRLLDVDSRYFCCYQLQVFSLTWADSALSLRNDRIACCLYSIEYWQLNQPRWCDRFSLKIVKWKVLCSHLVMLNFISSAADKALGEWKGNSIKTLAKLASWEH